MNDSKLCKAKTRKEKKKEIVSWQAKNVNI